MSTLGYVNITLPSKGLLYGGKIPDGIVAIRKPTVQEEVRIQGSANANALLSTLINSCCKLPADFRAADLLTTDRLAILIALRVHTFGSSYGYSYRCHGCGANNKADCDLATDIKPREVSDDLQEPILLQLPDAGNEVGLRFLRGADEDNIAKYAKKLTMASNDAGDPSLIQRMISQCMTLDGEDMSKRRAEVEKFVGRLTMTDSAEWRDALDSREPGIDITVYPECPHCGYQHEMGLPFTGEFFRPTRTRR